MADAIVSALAGTILENLNSMILEELGVLSGLKTELENLKSTFTTVQAVLHDAEEKQWKSKPVTDWLGKLKDVAYDAEDLLDEFAIEAQKRQRQRNHLRNRVRSFLSLDRNPLAFRVKMAHKLKDVREKLDAIAKDRHDFHLREGLPETEADSCDQRQTWSLVNESEIYGRDQEKEELINSLVNNSGDLSVYAICGMGGLGKTTLAQLIYNDGRVNKLFDLTFWLCVSDDSTIRRLTRAMIESIENNPCDIKELENLQKRLLDKLRGKKFFLVLDDVWDDFPDKWNSLMDLLRCGAKGSVVLVTTRNKMVSLKMEPVLSLHMEVLSNNDSWLLFERHAFGMRRREEYEHLESIGRAIVNKCGGLPLAIKALGKLLCLKKKESEWLSIKESEIWNLQEGKEILPALRLSYSNLSPQLKQCFVFCSIFPKDHVMEKDQLIALWMANGFISCEGPMDLHDKGHGIFIELVSRSFFQDVVEDISGNITCKMHDLVHDLARSIAGHECCLIEPSKEFEARRKVRHLTLGNASHIWGSLKGESLRTFRLGDCWWKSGPCPFWTNQSHLRALDASQCRSRDFPESIGKLKQLRYLDVSYSDIETLPESICSLQNLQTLNLRNCHYLVELPNSMKHLKDLMYLDITNCEALRCMPPGIGELTSLHKLGKFILGREDGHRIEELGTLNHLGGELSIEYLDNVKNLTDAKSANLMEKRNLLSLSLSWQDDTKVSKEQSEEVLCGLRPHPYLKKLCISEYTGSKYPSWMMELLLPNLVEIRLGSQSWCEQLPPFGKLQFLRKLELVEMPAVKYIGSDVYGGSENPFPSLEKLCLDEMRSLELWETVAGGHSFPCLRELTVSDCPLLIEIPNLLSIKKVEIEVGTVTLLRSITNFTSLTSLEFRDVEIPDSMLLPDGLLQNLSLLEHLKISNQDNIRSLSNQILDKLSALKSLKIWSLEELESLPEGFQNLSSLETLEIRNCRRLNCLPMNGLYGLSALRSLRISLCENLASLSEGVRYLTALEDLFIDECPMLNSLEGIQYLTSLRSLRISGCEGLSSLPNQIGNLTALSRLHIGNCSNLMSLPCDFGGLTILRQLSIWECPNLERRCEKERGEDWPKIAHIPDIAISFQIIQRVLVVTSDRD